MDEETEMKGSWMKGGCSACIEKLEKRSVRMDIGSCGRVWIFGYGKSCNGLEEREDATLHIYTLQWLPSKEGKCNFLAISLSLSLPDFNCLWQRTLAALQFDELQS